MEYGCYMKKSYPIVKSLKGTTYRRLNRFYLGYRYMPPVTFSQKSTDKSEGKKSDLAHDIN